MVRFYKQPIKTSHFFSLLLKIKIKIGENPPKYPKQEGYCIKNQRFILVHKFYCWSYRKCKHITNRLSPNNASSVSKFHEIKQLLFILKSSEINYSLITLISSATGLEPTTA